MATDRHAPVEVEANGVTVEKALHHTGDGVTRVVFTVASARERPAAVELVDALPEGVSKSRVGVDPAHGRECWTVEERRLTYRGVLGPGEEVVTVYGVGVGDAETLEAFRRAPTVEVKRAGGDGAAATGTAEAATDGGNETTSDDPAAALGLSGTAAPDVADEADGENGANPESEDAADGADDGPTADGSTPEGEGGPAAPTDGSDGSPATAEGGGERDDGHAAGPADGPADHPAASVGAALAGELAAGDLSADETETLRRELGGVSRSLELRLHDLQSTLHDVEVYRDALEEFIDDRGTADDLVEEFDARLAETREEVGDLSADVDAVAERVGAVDDRLADVTDRLESMAAVTEANRQFRERVAASASVDGEGNDPAVPPARGDEANAEGDGGETGEDE